MDWTGKRYLRRAVYAHDTKQYPLHLYHVRSDLLAISVIGQKLPLIVRVCSVTLSVLSSRLISIAEHGRIVPPGVQADRCDIGTCVAISKLFCKIVSLSADSTTTRSSLLCLTAPIYQTPLSSPSYNLKVSSTPLSTSRHLSPQFRSYDASCQVSVFWRLNIIGTYFIVSKGVVSRKKRLCQMCRLPPRPIAVIKLGKHSRMFLA